MRLRKLYGGQKWRKLKGIAQVRLANGRIRLAEVHWYEGHGVGKTGIQSEATVFGLEMKKKQPVQFVVCLDNRGYPASLEVGKLYRLIPDNEAEAEGLMRVVDESGEDYAFEAARFHVMNVPPAVERVLLTASHS